MAIRKNMDCNEKLNAIPRTTNAENKEDDPETPNWLVDKGSGSHICDDRDMFTEYEPYETPIELTGIGTNRAVGIGKVPLIFSTHGGVKALELHKVLHAPELPFDANILSVTRMTAQGYRFTAVPGSCEFTTIDTEEVLCTGTQDGRFWWLDFADQHRAPSPPRVPDRRGFLALLCKACLILVFLLLFFQSLYNAFLILVFCWFLRRETTVVKEPQQEKSS